MYIKRDSLGKIVAVHEAQNEEFSELAKDDDPEFLNFLKCSACKTSLQTSSLQQTDADFIRVLEDVIDVLIDKNLIQFTDLPLAAREKLSTRQHLRKRHRGLQVINEHEDEDSLKFL